MNHERHTPSNGSEQPAERGTPYPAPDREIPDWRRLEVTMNRFDDAIAGGIAKALEHRAGIDDDTARCIAHALSRSLERHSALSNYARTGEGDYETLRDEYLRLYNDPDAPAWVIELINWLGTHLIRKEHPDALTIDSSERYPLTLDRLLVPAMVELGDWATTIHVPGNATPDDISQLTVRLGELHPDEDLGLMAFLSLRDVNAMDDDIVGAYDNVYAGTYETIEDAITEICELDERARAIQDRAEEEHFYIDGLTPDYEALREDVEEGIDLVELDGRIYAFHK